MRYWLEGELADLFGVTVRLSARTADAVYDQIADCLRDDAYRPRALYERFGVEVLATTDDPADDLAAHAALDGRSDLVGTGDPDVPSRPLSRPARARLARRGRTPRRRGRRRHRRLRGLCPRVGGAAPVLRRARRDVRRPQPGRRPHRSARASRGGTASTGSTCGRGDDRGRRSRSGATCCWRWPGCRRGRAGDDAAPRGASQPPRRRRTGFGPDTGHDIPVALEFTDALRPLLKRFGTQPGFHLVVFTVDETVWSRELAPLAGFYPSVYVGRAMVVPRRARGDPSVPRRGRRDCRVLAHLRLRRRHPRVLLDPGTARHVTSDRRRGPRPTRRRASSRARTRPLETAVDLVTTGRPPCSSFELPPVVS